MLWSFRALMVPFAIWFLLRDSVFGAILFLFIFAVWTFAVPRIIRMTGDIPSRLEHPASQIRPDLSLRFWEFAVRYIFWPPFAWTVVREARLFPSAARVLSWIVTGYVTPAIGGYMGYQAVRVWDSMILFGLGLALILISAFRLVAVAQAVYLVNQERHEHP